MSLSTQRSSTLSKFPTEEAEEYGWQAQKRANTRTQITEAAIRYARGIRG